MKYGLLIIILVIAALDSAAQTDSTMPAKDSLATPRAGAIASIIAGGNVSIISMDLEKLIYLKPFLILGGGIGMGITGNFTPFNEEPDQAYFTLPLHLTCNFGKGRNFVELGFGGTLLAGGGETYYPVYPMLGYRLLPLKRRKFSFRAWFYYPFGQEVPDVLTGGFGAGFGISL